jgi:crotonobetainyl-CoA:carnitine CoA-transferase CaiB-like acyl-CoA transferase
MVPALGQTAGLGFGERAKQLAVINDALSAWFRSQGAGSAATMLLRAGISAASLACSVDLVASSHLRERGFWEAHGGGVLPGLPWRASFGRRSGEAPGLGADTDAVLHDVLDLSCDEIDALRRLGVLG